MKHKFNTNNKIIIMVVISPSNFGCVLPIHYDINYVKRHEPIYKKKKKKHNGIFKKLDFKIGIEVDQREVTSFCFLLNFQNYLLITESILFYLSVYVFLRQGLTV